NCENLACQQLVCRMGPFESGSHISVISFHSAINITALESVFGKKNKAIDLVIEAKVEISDPLVNVSSGLRQDTVNLITRFRRIPNRLRVKLWVLMISAACGLVILIFLLLALIQFGFFRRQKREELKKLMHQAAFKPSVNEAFEANEMKLRNGLDARHVQ
ncbi:integrin alpha-V-like protein, partial [Dinothrombium tinctorium]